MFVTSNGVLNLLKMYFAFILPNGIINCSVNAMKSRIYARLVNDSKSECSNFGLSYIQLLLKQC